MLGNLEKPAQQAEARPTSGDIGSDVSASNTSTKKPRAIWRSPVWLHLGVLAAFTLLAIIATWPMFPQLGGFVVDRSDPLYSIWAMAWQAHALVTDPGRLFDTNIMYPFKGTLAFDELAFAEAVMAAPIYLITGNPVLGHNTILFLSFPLSAYTMWLLVRNLTRNFWAAFVAGSIFAFSFYRLTHLPHITLIAIEWMPLLLLVSYKLLWTKQWKWAAALALLFAVQALSGHYLAFYSALMLGIFFVYYLVFERKLFTWKVVGQFAVGMVAAAAVMLPVLVPYVHWQSAYGFSRDIFEVERFSNTLSSFLSVYQANPLIEKLLSPFADPGPWAIERAAFPGIAMLVLAGVGVVAGLRTRRKPDKSGDTPKAELFEFGGLRKHVVFFLFIALLSALLSLGPSLQLTYATDEYDPNAIHRIIPLPYGVLHDYVPGFQSMRVAARIDVLIVLSLSVLAGIGMYYLLGWLRAHWAPATARQWSLPAIAIIVALIPIAEGWTVPIHMEPVGTKSAVPEVYRWLATQPPTILMEYPMTYYQKGDPNVIMENLYQYYGIYNWQETINASTSIRPYAFSAVVLETENCFPCPRSLDALWMLDTEDVVVHLDNLSGPQRTDFLWRSTNPAAKVVDDFIPIQDFGSDKVYKLKPRSVGQLKGVIPSGASILLASPENDPERITAPGTQVSGGYMAAVGYMLRDHPEYGDTRLTFGQTLLPVNSENLPDYAILWASQDPKPLGYLPENKIWSNEFISVYKLARNLAAFRYGAE